jgi:hypothetical protein
LRNFEVECPFCEAFDACNRLLQVRRLARLRFDLNELKHPLCSYWLGERVGIMLALASDCFGG